MLNIYLARHGQNVDNAQGILNGHRDLPLTELGEAQAYEVAEKVKQSGLRFDAIMCSPLSRAKRTAEIIAEVAGMDQPIVMSELIERDFGSMTGVAQSQVEVLCAPDILKTETITYFLSPEGAETFPDLLLRAERVLADLQRRYKDGSLLLVSHGDFGKMLYAHYYGLDWKEVLKLFHFGNSELLLLSEDSSPEEAHVFTITQYNS